MTATVLLARHARHDEVGIVLSGRSDIALNAAGRAEAAALAGRLATASLAAIYSSPRRRAWETALAVADRHGLEVIASDGLDEIDFGDWAGQPFAALDAIPAWRRWNAARGSAATPAGATLATITMRAVAAVEDAATTAGAVLCVSHADIIRAVVAHYLGLDGDRLLAFDIDPASLTTIALGHGGGRVVTVNERVA